MDYNNQCEPTGFFQRSNHKWGKWEKVHDLVRQGTDKVVGLAQSRQCEQCGKIELDRQMY